MLVVSTYIKVKVCAGSHQRALRKGYQLVLTLARASPKNEKKEKQQRLIRIRRVVSHAIRPAPSPPGVTIVFLLNRGAVKKVMALSVTL